MSSASVVFHSLAFSTKLNWTFSTQVECVIMCAMCSVLVEAFFTWWSSFNCASKMLCGSGDVDCACPIYAWRSPVAQPQVCHGWRKNHFIPDLGLILFVFAHTVRHCTSLAVVPSTWSGLGLRLPSVMITTCDMYQRLKTVLLLCHGAKVRKREHS